MRLFIKNMVSLRCMLLVKQELKKLGIKYDNVTLGLVEVQGELPEQQHAQLKKNLMESGLEVLDNKRGILIESIINVVTEMIHHSDDAPEANDSLIISERLQYDYTYLSKVFSEVKGITLQQFIIIRKVERVKELLLYNELNIAEISHKLHYSSAAHLSNQFKKVTGLSPSRYKKLKQTRTNTLENT